ncbi:hypothetical protein C8Q80DRAFT_1216783 [Daedaleopsis nitida]|nr:hypothetical protein C8Q80DRAFT_1216783 [Daedaleopsis nitida]
MDRQGRGPPPRQSSLPNSLHRLMVPSPSQPRRSATQEESGGASPEGGEDPSRLAPAAPAHPIPSARTGQQLPSTILAHAPRAKKPKQTIPPPEAGPSSESVPASQLPGPRPISMRPSERGASPRLGPEGARASPSSSYMDNYPVAVGPTAYHVTTLLPMRARILSPAVESGPSAASSASVSDSPGVPASRAPSQGAEAAEGSAEPEPASSSTAGKRRRRPRTEKGIESASSESSEHTHAPKSKKTLIACHFCRARKLRCDGQKPSCANCRKRNNPCTYEQEPKRRGPGKTPRGSTRRRGRSTAPVGGTDGGSGPEAGRGEGALTPERGGPSEVAPAPGLSASFPHTRTAFEPQLPGPVPTYPGFSYRPPSPSSSSSSHPANLPFFPYSVHAGPSRSAALASERVQSATSSAPSVPESEDSAVGEGGEYEELEEFYRQPQPGEREDTEQ